VCTLIKERKDSLKSGECTIVIAGEVGAGKTSLLNLILETQIFPVDSLKCTNTILEIRSSEKKDAIFYYKQQLSDNGERERKVPPKIISLSKLQTLMYQYIYSKCITLKYQPPILSE
jgi:septin family protein